MKSIYSNVLHQATCMKTMAATGYRAVALWIDGKQTNRTIDWGWCRHYIVRNAFKDVVQKYFNFLFFIMQTTFHQKIKKLKYFSPVSERYITSFGYTYNVLRRQYLYLRYIGLSWTKLGIWRCVSSFSIYSRRWKRRGRNHECELYSNEGELYSTLYGLYMRYVFMWRRRWMDLCAK